MRFLLAILSLLTGPALAQTITNPTPIALVCAYNSVIPAPTNGQFAYVQCDSTGKVITASSNTTLTANSTPTSGFSAGQFLYSDGSLLQATTFTTNGTDLILGSTGKLQWSTDAIMVRDAANTVAIRNSTTTQAFKVYNTYTDASNYERLALYYNSNVLTLEHQNAGTGVARSAKFNFGAGSLSLQATQTFFLNAAGTTTMGIKGQSNGIATLIDNTGTDFGRLQFGGTTSSYPALKRSSAIVQARLADDSAFAQIQGKLTTDTAYAAGTTTATGYITIYDSTGTAYKVNACTGC